MMDHLPQTVDADYDLFVSYAQADRAWVEGYLLDALAAANVRVISELDFQLGAPRIDEFARAVKRSRRTLLVISVAYEAQSIRAFVELLAQHYGIESGTWPVIPLLIEPVKLPPRLAILVHLDATDSVTWPDVVTRLCTSLKALPPPPSPKPPCPYPGMRAFQRDEAPLFFGRDAEIEALLQKLRSHPLVAVIGPSGSGKSSLVQAGLLPALEASTHFGMGNWLVRTLRPGTEPLRALADALGSPVTANYSPASLLAGTSDATRLLLVVDQLEEVFTLDGAARDDFFIALQRLATTPSCYVVLTSRSDLFDDLLQSSFWPAVRDHRLEIAPLDAKALHAAIVRPAEALHVYIESALVERLVAGSAGQPGLLPFVQEVLVRLWQRLERRYLPLRAYETLVLPLAGYNGDERSGIQAAMAQLADEIINKLSPEEQSIARRILLRLVQFGEGRADTRRQQRIAQLQSADDDPKRFAKVLAYLADNRLLVLSGEEEGEDRVDLAHEAMLTGWPRLQEWIATYKADEAMRRRLEARAEEWVQADRAPHGYLAQGEFPVIAAWLARAQEVGVGYSVGLSELIDRSGRRLRRRRQRQWAVRGVGVLVLLALFVNIGYLQWVNRGWSTVAALPQTGITTLTAGVNEVAAGSFGLGVARTVDGLWQPWQSDARWQGVAGRGLDAAAANVDKIIGLTYDPLQPSALYAWVAGEGLFWSVDEGADWVKLEGALPALTDAIQPLAVSNGTALAIGDDLGLHVWPAADKRWHHLAGAPPWDQEFESVVVDSDGVPYVAGESGILRGSGVAPWQWETLIALPHVRLIAIGEDQTIYVVMANGQEEQIRCFDTAGQPIGQFQPVPVTNWNNQILGFLIRSLSFTARATALIAPPDASHGFFLATNQGGVFHMDCSGNRHYIGQANFFFAAGSRLAMAHTASGEEILYWGAPRGLYWRHLE